MYKICNDSDNVINLRELMSAEAVIKDSEQLRALNSTFNMLLCGCYVLIALGVLLAELLLFAKGGWLNELHFMFRTRLINEKTFVNHYAIDERQSFVH